MKVVKLQSLKEKERETILKRAYGTNTEIAPVVSTILSNIQKYGDSAILDKYCTRYGSSYTLSISRSDVQSARESVSKEFLISLQQARENITKVCKFEKDSVNTKLCNVLNGITVWREWRAIEKVGLYIPGGKAVYPSSLLMTAIPAKIAGCKEIVVCSPPDKSGNISPYVLTAADELGITSIYKVGGAEAIGAMAYGTQTIPNTYKIFGAGNSYVTQAKLQVFGTVNIDMPAGPSEVLIIADETANPRFIAADLLADGEHGDDSGCVLVTTSQEIAAMTLKEIEKQLVGLPTAGRVKKSLQKYGLIGVSKSLDEIVAFTNEYAPEHLEIMTKDPERIVSKVQNAGSVFLGQWTTKSAGDYATGANHVLPTGGMAKMFPPLSIESFGKMMQIQKISSKKALNQIKSTIEMFGEIEQLPAHSNATKIRFQNGGE